MRAISESASAAILELCIHTGDAFWRQQGFANGHLAASSVLAELAGKLPALSDALVRLYLKLPLAWRIFGGSAAP